MKIMFVRHGEPDYEHDSLTPKGWREAKLLATRLKRLEIRDFYCSPLGRARDTAKETLECLHRKAIILDWLQEFPVRILDPDTGKERCAWDLLPSFWTSRSDLYEKDKWYLDSTMESGNAKEIYLKVVREMDILLEKYGYKRSGLCYHTDCGNKDTIVLFCHLGVELVLLSHFLGISAPVLWQGFFVPPTSVTILETEERQKGIAYFRCRTLGDTSHLYAENEPVSDSGFFQEVYGS